MNVPLSIAAMAVLMIFSAYFSATETAFSSLSRSKLKTLSETKKKAALALKMAEKDDKPIYTAVIGNTMVNIAISAIGSLLFVSYFGALGAVISIIVMTIAVIVFGEVTPKGLAKINPEGFAGFSAPIIRVFICIFAPFSAIFSFFKKLISKLVSQKNIGEEAQEKLIMIVDEVTEEGVIDSEESELLHNAITFSELKAEDILTHRTDIEAVSVDSDKEEIARIFSETKFSRLLVYEDTVDKIVGVIHLKDFYADTSITSKTVRDIMTSPVFILKNENIDDLLRKLQQHKSHIAVVLDEYGGTYGIVTMEDILEELVGDIWDEHDEVVNEMNEIDANVFRVDGIMNFEEFCEQFNIVDQSQSISLGGWMAEKLEKIPEVGESFEFGGLKITVSETESNRASVLEIEILKPQEEDVSEPDAVSER